MALYGSKVDFVVPVMFVSQFRLQTRNARVKTCAGRAVSGGRPRVAEALRARASVICLQHPSLPPHSTTEQVSLKKKVSPPSPLCQGGKQTLKRPANRKSYK